MKNTAKVIKKVSGRASYISFFKGDFGKAVKVVLDVDDEDQKKFGDRVEVLIFRKSLQEYVGGAILKDGKMVPGRRPMQRDDHVSATGPYRAEKWKDGKKSGINRTIVVNRKSDLTWQAIAAMDWDPWASDEAAPDNGEEVAPT